MSIVLVNASRFYSFTFANWTTRQLIFFFFKISRFNLINKKSPISRARYLWFNFLFFAIFVFLLRFLAYSRVSLYVSGIENGNGTSFASRQIKFQRADTRVDVCERERVNSIARERATRHARTHSRMHAFAYPHHPGCIGVHYSRRVRGFRNSRETKREGEREDEENPRRLWETKVFTLF